MNRSKLNYIIDAGLGISFVVCFFTGLIKFRELWRAFGIDSGNLYFRNIHTLHDLSGIIMGLLVLAHIILHWRWIVCMTKSFFKKGGECER